MQEYPLIQLPPAAGIQIKKAEAGLTGRVGPSHFGVNVHASLGTEQVKQYAQGLVRLEGANRLDGSAVLTEVANDPAVALLKGDVDERMDRVAVVDTLVLSRPSGTTGCCPT